MKKLVRDKIPDICLAEGKDYKFERMESMEEVWEYAFKKLFEEVAELRLAETEEEMLAELADIKEVMELIDIIKERNVSRAQVMKREERGAFDKLYVMEM